MPKGRESIVSIILHMNLSHQQKKNKTTKIPLLCQKIICLKCQVFLTGSGSVMVYYHRDAGESESLMTLAELLQEPPLPLCHD